MAEITLESLSKKYDKGVQALKNVNLKIKDHEFLVLLGPSGCGKTTLLRLIAGLETPTEGAIFFDGQDMSSVEPMKRNVSMVFQSFALYPHMNVYKNIAFPLKSMKMPVEEIKRRVEKTAKILDIEHILNCRPRVLSGGQRQRVALGRAMVREPVVFLLDEPLSNLDAKMRTELRDEIVRLHRELQTTFVYVTHDQAEAMQMADRIVVMEEGVIRQTGTPQQVYDCPNSVYVAKFIGTPQMNFFACRLNKKDDCWAVKIMGSEVLLPANAFACPENLEPGQKVIVGVRPEDFRLESAGSPFSAFSATVRRAVPMGAGLHVECECEGQRFLCVLQNHSEAETGSSLELKLAGSSVHVFDGETQMSLLSGEDRQ